MNRFRDTLPKESQTDPKKIESAFKTYCKDLKLKENRFVSYILCWFRLKNVQKYNFYLINFSVTIWEELRMQPLEFWEKCQNPCHGECHLKKFVKSSKRKTDKFANFDMVSFFLLL